MYISLTKITIVLCWLSLFSFWAIKIFGGNWFEIMVENENFVKFSDTVQNTWLKYITSLISTGIAHYFVLGAIFQKAKFDKLRFGIYAFSFVSAWAVANFVELLFLKVSYAYIVFTIIALIFNKGKRKINGMLFTFIDFVFTTISMITRNLQLSLIKNYLILMILSYDVYIMYCLYFLYCILIKMKGEKNGTLDRNRLAW